MKTKSTYTIKDAASYFLMLFITLLLISLLLEFLLPIKEFLTGDPVDFAASWNQANLSRRLSLSLAVSLVFAVYKYQKEQKREQKQKVKGLD